MGIGALAKLGTMSLGRELFGFLLRSDLNVAKIAEWAGITMDTLKDRPPEALSAILERAARSGAIDPREANNINIQLAKDAQEAMPAMPSIKKETRGSPENPYEVLTYLDETSGEPLGEMYLRKLRDGSNEVASVTVNPETRRQGVATALYNAAGISAPSDNITLDAFNFWKNRDPNSLPDSLYNYYDDLIGLEIPDMGLITDVRNNFASVKKGGISGPLYKNQLQDMGLIPKEPK
jgi:ribosomal protein S18 acetylase RimI-like enzyme